MTFYTPNGTEGIKDRAIQELRDVAEFLDVHAETLLRDFDNLYIAEHGCRIELEILPRDSVTSIKVQKEYLVVKKAVDGGLSD